MRLPDVENQDAGYISKKEVVKRCLQNNFHETATFLIRNMRPRSALEGAYVCACYECYEYCNVC